MGWGFDFEDWNDLGQDWNISIFRYIGQNLDDLLPVVTLVVALHIMVVGFIYMLYKIFGVRSLRVTLNTEVQSVITSIGILVILVSLNTIIPPLIQTYISNISGYPNYYYSPSTFTWSPYESLSDIPANSYYLNENGQCMIKGIGNDCNSLMFLARMYPGVIYQELTNYLTHLTEDYSYFQSFDSLGPSLDFGFMLADRSFGASIYASPSINGIYRMILTNLISDTQKIMFIVKFIETSLLFIEKGLGVFLIGFGLAFRAAPLTKRLGAFMIALGIVFMYVFPALMALSWVTFPVKQIDYAIDKFPLDNGEFDFISKMYSGVFFSSVAMLLVGIAGASESLSAIFVLIYMAIYELFGFQMGQLLGHTPLLALSLFTDFSKGLPGTLDYLSKFYLEGLGIPLFNLYISFSLVKGLSSFFGGYFEIPGLARLI